MIGRFHAQRRNLLHGPIGGFKARSTRTPAGAARRAPAFSFAETALAVVLVSGLMVVTMNLAGVSRVAQQGVSETGIGQLLAAALMSEILALPYEEPLDAVAFGREAGELATSRAAYDDVDDYNGWTESPPQDKSGKVLPDRTGWRRQVAVARVNPNALDVTSLLETGAKRITVTVTHESREVAVLVAIRTDVAAVLLHGTLELIQ